MTSSSTATTRLHITPLNAELLPLVLPASIRPLATDISFHEIPTFPENNYGYVTLPAMEADKIKKKLNGSILKGRKFKVDSARPQKRQRDEEDGQNTDKPSSGEKSKKHKAEGNVLEGYELPSDRKVKRGWTESTNDKADRRKKEKKSKSKDEKRAKPQLKSKYTEKAECLFRTKVPPNRASPEPEKTKKKSKKNKSSHESVVHEFSKTITQPTFLRSDDGGKAVTTTFDEDKGWSDESGDLKEPASERIRKDQYRPGQVAGHKEKPRRTKAKPLPEGETPEKAKTKGKPEEPSAMESESEDWTSSSGSSSSEGDSTESESDESTSSSSSDESDADDSENDEKKRPDIEKVLGKSNSTESKSEEQSAEVHPLEALFKKPAAEKKPDLEPPAQFSFFGQGDEESEDETPAKIAPLTPFTKRDLQDRGLRSAAPTPDTSQVTKTINWNPSEKFETSLYTESPVSKPGAGSKDESDFAKWFWENRGDNNRAWKKRRRDAAKEQRQRENRRKGMKGKS
ncbi:hypothetical protein BJX65DRAFT_273557 [Aspergillus insuetus]